jgi:hypothetical protein
MPAMAAGNERPAMDDDQLAACQRLIDQAEDTHDKEFRAERLRELRALLTAEGTSVAPGEVDVEEAVFARLRLALFERDYQYALRIVEWMLGAEGQPW